MQKIYFLVLGVMTLVTFSFYAVDKVRAKNGGARLPELLLLTLATLGGGVGALLGKVLLRHKSNARRKPHFAVILPLSAVLQITLGVYLTFFQLVF